MVAHDPQLLGVEGQRPLDAEGGEGVVVEPAHRDRLRRWAVVGAGMEHRLGRPRGPVLDDRVGDDASQQEVGAGGVGPGRELDPPAGGGGGDRQPELGAGVHDGVGGGVGDAGVERDLDRDRGAGVGDVPGAGLQERIGEEGGEALEVGGREVALDEHHVGDLDGPCDLDPEGGRAGPDGVGAGVGIDGPEGQSMTVRHCRDPTVRGACSARL